MKKLVAVCLFIVMGACLHAQALSWEIKFLKVGAAESVPISKKIVMKTGDLFQITITPDSDCFCYVVIYDSAKDITILNDQPLQKNETKSLGPFEIEDPSGTETIYVIMDLKKQAELEGFMGNFKQNPSPRNGEILRQELVNLQTTASKLGNPVTSFIPSAATTRDLSTDKNVKNTPKDEYVTRFSGKDRYVRTIAVSH